MTLPLGKMVGSGATGSSKSDTTKRPQDEGSALSLVDPNMVAVNAHTIVSIVSTSGHIEQVNDLFLKTFGFSEDEVLGMPGNLIYAENGNVSFDEVHRTLLAGECWNGEQLLQRKDGTQFWAKASLYPLISPDGEHLRSMAVRTDITDEKIMRSELDMYSALDLFEDSMFMFTTDTLRFTYMNRAAQDRWGLKKRQYINRTLQEGNPRFDPTKFMQRAAPLLNGEVSEVVYTSDIYEDAVEVTLRMVTTAENLKRFVSIERNIEDRVRLERSRSAFTASVSHELRSPLTSIKGGLGLVLSGAAGELPEKATKLLEISRRNVDRLVLIVNDILDLEKITAGRMAFNFRSVDIVSVIREALEGCDAIFTEFDISIRTDGLDREVALLCDPDRILQVLTNLLANAAKFSTAGSNVRVGLFSDAQRVIISVQDFGAGIPKDAQAAIFERFTQAQNQQSARAPGTGLGLSIVKAIVDGHGGEVKLVSKEGAGTLFRVILPRAHDAHTEGMRTQPD